MNEQRDWERFYELRAIHDQRMLTSSEQAEYNRLWWKLVAWAGLAGVTYWC